MKLTVEIKIKTKIRIRIRKTYSLLFSWFTMTSAPPSFSSAVMADLLTQNDIKPIILSSFPHFEDQNSFYRDNFTPSKLDSRSNCTTIAADVSINIFLSGKMIHFNTGDLPEEVCVGNLEALHEDILHVVTLVL